MNYTSIIIILWVVFQFSQSVHNHMLWPIASVNNPQPITDLNEPSDTTSCGNVECLYCSHLLVPDWLQACILPIHLAEQCKNCCWITLCGLAERVTYTYDCTSTWFACPVQVDPVLQNVWIHYMPIMFDRLTLLRGGMNREVPPEQRAIYTWCSTPFTPVFSQPHY